MIKIERPEGDFARGYERRGERPVELLRLAEPRQETVALDLATADGKARLAALIASADVVVQNLKPAPWRAWASRPRRFGRGIRS